jgi:hypothetical protein
MKKRTDKKLSFTVETIRELREGRLSVVAGGLSTHLSCPSPTQSCDVNCAPPTHKTGTTV